MTLFSLPETIHQISLNHNIQLLSRSYILIKFFRYRKEFIKEQKKLDAFAPKAGDIPPDFELFNVDGENPVRLSKFRGQKPVALVFGSFT